MALDIPAAAAHLAERLVGAERTVLLSGQRMGRSERVEAQAPGEWARRASLENLLTRPEAFWAFYLPLAREIAARQPGPGHRAVARLSAAGLVWAHVTQSVDRLHQRAGGPEAIEVYGNALSARCERCGERYGLGEVADLVAGAPDGVPRCTTRGCGYPLRPSGTLWNEPLPAGAVTRAWELAGQADLFVVLDSELRTAPISMLPSVPLGREVRLVLVGDVPTQYDRYATLVVRSPSPPVLEALLAHVGLAPEARPEG
jgi:NAD-dependent protein deacetylase/lipoamidase